jgi:CubicO group peptidase (beta-lactamase class C family)
MIEPPSRRIVLAGALAAGAAPALAATPYWPAAADWATVAPEAAGFDPTRLAAAVEAALAANSRDVLVLRGGRMVAERYAAGWGPERSLEVASVGKSLVAVLIGMALEDGHIGSLDQPAADFIPTWKSTPKAAITLRHLMSMTSGLDDRGLALRNIAGDQFALNAAAPQAHPPGTRWAYNTAVYHLLFHVLERAVAEPFPAYAQRKLLGPLGMARTTWLTNQGQGASGPVTNYYTAICSGRDLARFGLFAARGGRWAGRRLIGADLFRTLTTPSQELNPSYGLLWWLNSRPGVTALGTGAPALRFPGSPPDTIAALGAGGQMVAAIPSLDLVVIRQGAAPGSETVLPDLVAGVVAGLQKQG